MIPNDPSNSIKLHLQEDYLVKLKAAAGGLDHTEIVVYYPEALAFSVRFAGAAATIKI